MVRIKMRLAKVLQRLTSTETQLKRARKRYKAARSRAQREHERQIAFQTGADRSSGKIPGGYPNQETAGYLAQEANRCAHRAFKSHLKAQYWLGQIKTLILKERNLEIDVDKIKADLAQWKEKHGVVVEGNKVVGGTPGQRWKVALLASVKACSEGMPRGRRNFYSMSGNWDIDHELKGGPEYGHRSDCSSTVTGWAKACGLPDPNGEDFHGGYTGTLGGQHNGWKEVSRHYMETSGKPAYIVFGRDPGHHTEGYLGPGDRTAGHGDSAVDFGIVDDFGDGDFRCYAFGG